jgi:RimJ/RimL family protein N-acetyltransferase
MQTLKTSRLILRPWEDRDRAPLADILGDAQVRRFYPSPATPAETNAQIDSALAKIAANGFHLTAAELKSTCKHIGLIGLGVIPDETRTFLKGSPHVEIGWQLGKQFWGQGLAPEGAQAWLGYAWDVLDLPEVVAFTAAINLPSQRVMQKLGMVRDKAGDFEQPRVAEGHPLRPHVLYRISNPRG